MNTKTIALIGTLVLASTAACAGQSGPLTRLQVRQSVLAAEAAGQLIPAGEGEVRFAPAQAPSTLTRGEVEHDVITAQRAGQLIPAGEGEWHEPALPAASGMQLTRAEVKADTLRAVAAGEIIPAGEGNVDHVAQHASATALHLSAR